MYLGAMYRGNQHIPKELPILGPYFNTCDRLGLPPSLRMINHVKADDNMEWRDYSAVWADEQSPLMEEQAWNMVKREYDINPSDIEDWVGELESITPNGFEGAVLNTPEFFSNLAKVDYEVDDEVFSLDSRPT
jgi:hypothetical protein